MPLPQVDGWLIDYRTAAAVYESASNERIDHCTGMCEGGDLCFCSLEDKFFGGHDRLQPIFIEDNDCRIIPDNDVMSRTEHIMTLPFAKPFRVGGQSIVVISAIAIARNFGIISDHTSDSFVTAADICAHYGVPVMTMDAFFDDL